MTGYVQVYGYVYGWGEETREGKEGNRYMDTDGGGGGGGGIMSLSL